MKIIRCLVQPHQVDRLMDAFASPGIVSVTVTGGSTWRRDQPGRQLVYRGRAYSLKFMPESVLEVVCRAPQELLDELERLPAVKEAALFGNALHLVAADGAEAARQVSARLAELGQGDARVEAFLHCVSEDRTADRSHAPNEFKRVSEENETLEEIRAAGETLLIPRMGPGAEAVGSLDAAAA